MAGLLLGICLIPATLQARQTLQPGDMPPPKIGRTASGDKVNLADYKGRVVVISFWASWCGPCRKELPILASLQKQVSRNDLAVFAINWREDSERYGKIVRALKGYDLTLVSDETGYVGDQYNVDAIPHMIVIGRDGKISAIHIGYGEGEIPTLVDEINALLAQPKSSAS